MIVVIDVCAAVEIILQQKKAGKFNKELKNADVVYAPDLYISELTNALWKIYTSKMKTEDECIKYIQQGLGLINTFVNAKEIWEQAFSEGINNKHSVYDMLYMVTARRNGGTLITNDAKLAAVCKKNHIKVCC